jgi:hypothetical protein
MCLFYFNRAKSLSFTKIFTMSYTLFNSIHEFLSILSIFLDWIEWNLVKMIPCGTTQQLWVNMKISVVYLSRAQYSTKYTICNCIALSHHNFLVLTTDWQYNWQNRRHGLKQKVARVPMGSTRCSTAGGIMASTHNTSYLTFHAVNFC